MKDQTKVPSPETGLRKFLHNILYPGGLISTILLFLMAMIAELTNVDADFKPALTLRSVAVVILFSFVLALSNRILCKKDMNFGARIALHCLCTSADFVVVFIFLGGYYTSGTSALAVTAIFIAFYLIIAAITAIIRGFIKRQKSNNSSYKRQF